MNSLNSFLIEGVLIADPVLSTVSSGAKLCTFAIESERYFQKNGEREKEVSVFRVETWNRTAEAVAKTSKKGHGVRVVGRVRCINDSFIVVGESVEFKPKFDKKEGSK